MNTRFEQLQQYDALFGFLYNINTMRQLNDDDLLKCCMDLDLALRSESSHDLDSADLCAELCMFKKFSTIFVGKIHKMGCLEGSGVPVVYRTHGS
jgi:hypothetical protein